MIPSLVAESPPGWLAAPDVPAPSLAEGSPAIVTEWNVHVSSDDSRAPRTARMLACVSTPIPGWLEDMRPSTLARTEGLGASMIERFAGATVEARRENDATVFVTRDPPEVRVGFLRTFLAFDPSHVFTCFAACARHLPREDVHDEVQRHACESSVAQARLVGGEPAPAPGLGLRAVAWGVQRPRTVAWGAAVLISTSMVVAVLTRRRPRLRR